MPKRQILLSVTSINGKHFEKIEECKKLGVSEIAFFPTAIGDKKERVECGYFLEKAGITSIPFVHLRGDMVSEELDFWVDNFGTQIFNIHANKSYPWAWDFSGYKKRKIYIENADQTGNSFLSEEAVRKCGGICIDFSHLEDGRKRGLDAYEKNIQIIKKYPIGCAHVGPIRTRPLFREESCVWAYDSHFFEKLSQFDYLKKYPDEFFPSFIALEVENPIVEQIKARDYLIKLMGWND